MQVISYNFRILTTQEQKLSPYDQELCAKTFALSHYEFIVIGSNFPKTTFTDHNSNLFLFTRKGNLTPRQAKAQMLITMKLICMKMMILLQKAILNKTHNPPNRLIQFKLSSPKSTTCIPMPLILFKIT